MHMRGLLHAAGLESEAKAPLQSRAAQRLGGSGRSCASSPTFGREQKRGMAMGLPLLAQEFQGALGQGHVAVTVAFALADVQEHPLRIDVAHLQAQAFAQTESAGVNRGQADVVIKAFDFGEYLADLASRKDHGQLELGIGADQLQLVRPPTFKSLFPEELKGTNELGGGLAGDLFDLLEVDAVLPDLLEGDQLGRPVVVLAELADTGQVGLFGARADGQQLEVIGVGF